jgi:hypothetical protein
MGTNCEHGHPVGACLQCKDEEIAELVSQLKNLRDAATGLVVDRAFSGPYGPSYDELWEQADAATDLLERRNTP